MVKIHTDAWNLAEFNVLIAQAKMIGFKLVNGINTIQMLDGVYKLLPCIFSLGKGSDKTGVQLNS